MELVGRTAMELAESVRVGKVSALEVVRDHLDHLAEVEPRLRAFVAPRRAAAMDEATALDQRGDLESLPLAGVPIAIDDAVDVAGEPTRRGSTATSAAPVEQDARIVANLRAAGAVPIGKTRCPELALWGTCDDEAAVTVSPWDATRSAGGSGGGAAAAVAAGVVPVGVGFDGHGSLRIPAAACGVLGFKPGAGRLAVTNPDGTPHWFGMSRYGVLATDVADVALTLEVMGGRQQPHEVGASDDELRIAVSWKPPAPGVLVTASWREAAIEAGRLFRHVGHEVEHADPPYDRGMVQAVVGRWTQGVGADVEALGIDVEALQPRTRAQVAAGKRLARVAPVRDEDAQAWRERVAPFLETYDVLVTPAFARPQPAAIPWDGRPWAANIAANFSTYPFTGAWNLADLPSVVVPLWHDHGRPLAVQLVTGPGRDRLLLQVVAQLASVVPWQRHAPGWGVADRADEGGSPVEGSDRED